MRLISKKTDYAIKAICFIAEAKGRVVSVAELIREFDMPRPFLRKILQILKKSGILKSYKGQDGGFTLAIPAREIFVANLIKIFHGPIKLSRCVFKERLCSDVKTCALKVRIDTIETRVARELQSINIESLLK